VGKNVHLDITQLKLHLVGKPLYKCVRNVEKAMHALMELAELNAVQEVIPPLLLQHHVHHVLLVQQLVEQALILIVVSVQNVWEVMNGKIIHVKNVPQGCLLHLAEIPVKIVKKTLILWRVPALALDVWVIKLLGLPTQLKLVIVTQLVQLV
jgi:hypothetical protein